jgi:hypothetical protein
MKKRFLGTLNWPLAQKTSIKETQSGRTDGQLTASSSEPSQRKQRNAILTDTSLI